MKLTVANVKATLMACLYDDTDIVNGELRAGIPEPVLVHSIVFKAGFNSAKLAAQKGNIKAMLNELPLKFHKATGGGMSFSYICDTKDGTQWGEPRDCDKLLALVLPVGFAHFL